MKRIPLLLTLSMVGALSSTAAAAGVPPALSLPDLDGKIVTLRDVQGASPVLLVFYRGYW
jgi:hypothetical protein